MKKPHYSGIREEPKAKPDGGFLTHFYDASLKPDKIFGIFILIATTAYVNLRDPRLNAHQDRKTLLICMLALSVFGGFRAIQSMWLAKRDYPHIEANLGDTILFSMLVAFTSGVPLYGLIDQPIAVMWAYFALAFAVTLNFWTLYAWRIDQGDTRIDYLIDRKIQRANLGTFALITTLMFYSAYSITAAGGASELTSQIAILATCPLFLLNMRHSHELTFLPKFHLTNLPDSPRARIQLFKTFFWQKARTFDEKSIWTCISNEDKESYRELKTVRVEAEDIPTVTQHLISGFGYVFQYIFDSKDTDKLRQIIAHLLCSSSGLSKLGYMNYYWVVDVTEKTNQRRVALIKPETRQYSLIYNSIMLASLPFATAKIFGWKSAIKTMKRAQQVALSSPPPLRGELRLTYLFVIPEHRRKSYAKLIMQMLHGAFIWTSTNEVIVDRITVITREANNPALKLFEKLGYRCASASRKNLKDPFANYKRLGRARTLEYSNPAND